MLKAPSAVDPLAVASLEHAAQRPPASTQDDAEAARLRALHALQVLDSAPEALFDDIAQLAAQICGTPVALVSLVDEHRQWFKARVGMAATQTSRDIAFCAHAIQQPGEVFEVPDAQHDQRFSVNPLVTGDLGVRFYAGASIVTEAGHALGTVCAMGPQPRRLSEGQRAGLQALARQAARLLEWRHMAQLQAAARLDDAQRSREQMMHLAALASHSLDLQAFIDNEGVVRYVNERYLDYWGLAREQVEGRHVAQVMGPQAFEQRVAAHLALALTGEPVHYSASFDYPGRGLRQVRVSYLPVRDDQGRVKGVVGRAVDVHDIESARQALAQANESLLQKQGVQQRFIHIISHDLREPVNTICNFAGLLQEDHGSTLDAEGARCLGFIRQGGQRMRTLLDDLLAYVRLDEHGAALLNAQTVDLAAVFAQVLADLDHVSGVHRARFLAGELPQVWGDPSLLRLLFQNLLSNAIKFHAPGAVPQVSWGFRAVAGGVAVHVQDQGIGIPAAQQPRLFNTFSRLVTRQQFEGTGLGLATCRRIAELHGGRIELHSEPGAGSRFTVTLPTQAGSLESPS